MLSLLFSILLIQPVAGQSADLKGNLIPVANGWAANSVNTVVFRKNALVSFNDTQYIAFYDSAGYVVLGKRKSASPHWELRQTRYKGRVTDAHNSISIMVDGTGFLHLAWDHHNSPIQYCKSIAPGSLEMTERMPMTGKNEQMLTYPEFYHLPGGGLLFLYRDGESGQGNLVINSYNPASGKWRQLHSNLIDGEGQRNAYWQACVDMQGTIHLSWVWRETPDVASNHDICYARSTDGGISWTRSNGSPYQLPVTTGSAEYVWRIPQNNGLINQTSMYADEKGNPFIASYWQPVADTVTQFHLLYKTGKEWKLQNTSFRKTSFLLGGVGTKRMPISRPQVIAWKKGRHQYIGIIFRDEERGNKFSMAINRRLRKNKWTVQDISGNSVGSSEPLYDTELWKQQKKLHLFIQFTQQTDAEGHTVLGPQPVSVLEWKQ